MQIIMYFMLIIGLILLFASSMQGVIRRVLYGVKPIRREYGKKGVFVDHVRSLLFIVYGENASSLVELIVITNMFFTGMTFFWTLSKLNLKMAVFSGFCILVGPYALLRLKLYTIRIESSYEGEFLLTELINQYKINNFNMVEAIDASIAHLANAPQSRRLIFHMSLRLKSYSDRQDLERILYDFTYGINTQWSRLLMNNILLSIDEGLVVTSGLVDIQNELKRAKKAYEKGARNTSEGFAIVKYLIPALYGFTVFMSIKYFDFTLHKFIAYQVFTPSGMHLLIVNGALYVLNILLMVLFNRRKFDIA
ncbi:hypothetical protein [Fusibacter sp. JL216-2]|uniref:hypothetical protein n=1 Tax=Fusibacter sp. JL216-2 TaxID=3071453 RepID=UPI003D346479